MKRTPSSGDSAGHTSPPSVRLWSALACVYVIWGSTYVAIRVMVEDIPPMLGAGVRFLIAGGVMVGVLAVRGHRIRVPRRELAAAALIGVLLPAGGNGVVTIAERNVPAGLAALLVASVPLWVVLLRRIVGRERIARATIAGVAVGFCGLGVLLLPGSRPADASLGGILLVLLAACSWASGSFLSPRLALPSDPLVSTAWQLVVGGVVLLAGAIAAGEPNDVHLAHTSADAWLALAYLIAPGSWLTYTAYSWLLQNAPISQVATYAYVNPVVAVLLAWAILGESLGAATLAGAALVIVSVAVIVTRESASPRPTTRREKRCITQPAAIDSVS